MLTLSMTFILGATRSLRPYWQLSARHDAGDGHTGAGVELTGGLRYSTARIEAQMQLRCLAVRTGQAYEEFGASASLEFKPRSDGMGLTASLQQGWGSPGGGTQSMWRDQPLRASGAPSPHASDSWSTDARVGYALARPRRPARPAAEQATGPPWRFPAARRPTVPPGDRRGR